MRRSVCGEDNRLKHMSMEGVIMPVARNRLI